MGGEGGGFRMSAPLLGADGGWAGAAAAGGDSALGGSSNRGRSWQQRRPSRAGSRASAGLQLPLPPPPPPRGRHRLCPQCRLPSCPRHPVCFSPFPKVSNLAEQLEERLFQLYSLHNELIQERLQELAEVMERVRQAEDELQQVCHTVEAAYRDLCLQPET